MTESNATSTEARETAGSKVIAALESLWAAMRRHHPDLPDVVIITGMGAGGQKWGHTGYGRWAQGEIGVELDKSRKAAADRLAEVFIAGERLACGATLTTQTLIHEAAHVLASVRELQDTSRQGRYHNRTFVKLCGELGLEWPSAAKPDKTIGFSAVKITDETRKRYADEIAALGQAIRLFIPLAGLMALSAGVEGDQGVEGPNMPKQPTAATGRQATLATCACEPPRRIRVAPSVFELGGISCNVCDDEFEQCEG
jgi:hypothetical protein